MPVVAATIAVTDAGDAGGAATCTLRQAIAAANTDTVIGICAAGSGDDTIVFTPLLSYSTISLTAGALAVNTPIAIAGSGQTIDAGGNSRVFTIASTTFGASDLTLTNGHATGTSKSGGALSADASAVTLSRVIISGNNADFDAGAIYSNGGSLRLADCTIQGNSALSGSHSTGGIVVDAATLDISNTLIDSNSGTKVGGLRLISSQTTARQSAFSNNTAQCTHAYCAGGVYASGGTVDMVGMTITGNRAQGAIGYLSGGVYLFNSAATLTNATIASNSAQGTDFVAGAIWETHAQSGSSANGLSCVHCTVASNTSVGTNPAARKLGAVLINVFNPAGFAGRLTLNNSIVTDNQPAHSDLLFDNATISATYNLLGSAQDASPFSDPANHNVFSDTPELGPLQYNGGQPLMLTLLPSGTSPALNIGSAALAKVGGVALMFDQRGDPFSRNVGAPDAGAAEFQFDRIFGEGFEPGP